MAPTAHSTKSNLFSVQGVFPLSSSETSTTLEQAALGEQRLHCGSIQPRPWGLWLCCSLGRSWNLELENGPQGNQFSPPYGSDRKLQPWPGERARLKLLLLQPISSARSLKAQLQPLPGSLPGLPGWHSDTVLSGSPLSSPTASFLLAAGHCVHFPWPEYKALFLSFPFSTVLGM